MAWKEVYGGQRSLAFELTTAAAGLSAIHTLQRVNKRDLFIH